MGSWSYVKLGTKVKVEEKTRAMQFLQALTDCNADQPEFDEGIGRLYYSEFDLDTPEWRRNKRDTKLEPVSILIDEENVMDGIGILEALEDHANNYMNQFEFGYYNDSEDCDDEDAIDGLENHDSNDNRKDSGTISILDEIYYVLNKLFAPARLYVAHEWGVSSSDSYYRYEAIYDPGRRIISVAHYYCSEGDGIDAGTKKERKKIVWKAASSDLINNIISNATSQGFEELVQRLEKCK